MDWLNYHHLYYFWVVAREGTVTGAAETLRLSPSTVSAQVKSLEESLGQPLFRKSGRNIALTDTGQSVFLYAEEIFTLGRELMGFVQGRHAGRQRLNVGLSMVVPKQVAQRVLEPALGQKVRVVCREGPIDNLLTDLALHHLDVVITDAPLRPDAPVRAFNHLLGESGVELVAAPELAARYREGFPASLDGAPFHLPTTTTVVRRLLDRWFDERGVEPDILTEFDDSAMTKVVGQRGQGLLPVSSVVRDEVCALYGFEAVGPLDGLRERFYAVTVERRIEHPAVAALLEGARTNLFP